ncbi:heterokaryon incompatibility protein-domain-containing protein [Boeremia exigua]|uniref:heterokaryon incompatibility protein-domain-containing protein n=1 Tax=Boeremia exigua TaxID=749465 RepID=UPI001E8ECA38|nr:heterokaryon incompatibility protein-domain-containing protein [Boeremia exigua]KAH6642040.1 heterokaryon incompatibility protein-domain-containing protein [Boeremia exigua]
MYEPLPTKTSTRLLSLAPLDSEDAPLCGSLAVVDLHDEADFRALSYTWGDPINPPDPDAPVVQDALMFCGGKEIRITSNLDAALRTILRRREEDICNDLPLWVDALCINQNDIKERSSQVGIMNQIYSRASLVIAWLGPADEISDVAIPQILTWPKGEEPEWTHGMYEFLGFFGRQYFRRCWILQEVILSQQICFLCGSEVLQFSDLSTASSIFLRRAREREIDKRGIVWHLVDHVLGRIPALYNGRESMRLLPTLRKELTNFSRLLELVRLNDCADPRDKVYSILSLLPLQSDGSARMTPDYTKSVFEVYSEATRLWISEERSLDILAWVVAPSERHFADHPTWVAELYRISWTVDVRRISASHRAQRTVFLARDPSAPITVCSGNSRVLGIWGVDIDRVLEFASPPSWRDSETWLDPMWLTVSATSDHLDDAHYFSHVMQTQICMALILHLHRLYWEDQLFASSSHSTTLSSIVANLAHLRNNYPGTFIPSDGEFQEIATVSCRCDGNILEAAKSVQEPMTFSTMCPYVVKLEQYFRENPGPELPDITAAERDAALEQHRSILRETLAKTSTGRFVLVPLSSELGDSVFILRGASIPFVLRKVPPEHPMSGDEPRWEVVGEARVHGGIVEKELSEIECLVGPVHLV